MYFCVQCFIWNYVLGGDWYHNMFSREANLLIGPDMKLESKSMREGSRHGKEGNTHMVWRMID